MSADELQRLFPSYRDEAKQMVVDTMQSAATITISRPQWGAFINQMDADIIRDDLTANQALDDVIRRLPALSAQV